MSQIISCSDDVVVQVSAVDDGVAVPPPSSSARSSVALLALSSGTVLHNVGARNAGRTDWKKLVNWRFIVPTSAACGLFTSHLDDKIPNVVIR